jgi:hypothetical protein
MGIGEKALWPAWTSWIAEKRSSLQRLDCTQTMLVAFYKALELEVLSMGPVLGLFTYAAR